MIGFNLVGEVNRPSVVHKASFPVSNVQSSQAVRIALPAGRELLRIEYQGPNFAVWYLTEPDAKPTCHYEVLVVYTGQPFDGIWTYWGTVMRGPLVFHVFARMVDIEANA